MLNIAFLNANVITVDDNFSIEHAVWVLDGRIEAVGSNEMIAKQIDDETQVVDLAGKSLMPGFIDTHGHIALFGLDELKTSLTGAHSREEILARIQSAAEVASTESWIMTTPIGTPPYFLDFEEIRRKGQLPSREDLDRVAPNNPVYIMAPTNRVPNSAILNSQALALAGISNTTDTGAPIDIVLDEKGNPTGELRGAMQPLYNPYPFYQKIEDVIPRTTYEDIKAGIKTLAPEFIHGGTTSLLEAHLTHPDELRAYGELLAEGALPLRIFFTFEVEIGATKEELKQFVNAVRFAAGNGFGDARLKVVGLSAGLDGPYWHGAACNDKPYPGPFGDTVNPGTLNSAETYRQIVELAVENNLRLHTECAGRGSIQIAIDTLRDINQRTSISERRFVLEHVEFPTPEQIASCKELGLIPTTSTNFVWGKGAEVYQQRLGKEYADHAIPLREWLDGGVPICQSTDWGPRSAFFTLWQSLKRYAGLTYEVIGENQHITREEAIRIFTMHGALALKMENEIGSIEKGKLADLIVLDKNPLDCEEDEIRDINVLATMVDGAWVGKPLAHK